MVQIKFEGKQPTLGSMKEMRSTMASIRKHGNVFTKNRYFVYEGSTLRAAQPTKKSALKYMNKNRTIYTILK